MTSTKVASTYGFSTETSAYPVQATVNMLLDIVITPSSATFSTAFRTVSVSFDTPGVVPHLPFGGL